MQDKKTYTIDENALRAKFASYSVSFNPSSLDFLDTEIAHVKTHQPIELPEAKNILKLIAIPVSVVVLGCIIYFGYGYVKSTSPASSAPKDTVTLTKTISRPMPIKEEVKPSEVHVSNTPTVSVKTEIKKQIVPIVSVPQKIKNIVKAPVSEPIVVPKKDSTPVNNAVAIPVADSIGKKSKADTATTSKEKDSATKKKKKKHKNSLDATDDIRKSTQKPNSADDDVIVPDNN